MLTKFSSHSIFYILIVWILGTCYGFVLLSSAAGHTGDVKLFIPGEELVYNLHSTVLMNEKDGDSKNVGFFTSAEVLVQVIYSQENQKILKLKINNPKLHIKSRKAPSPDGFVYHTSELEKFRNQPFYIHWNNGKIEKFLVNRDESITMVNVKKGIASLFQFQILDGTYDETDASGTCTVEYTSPNQQKISKTKKNCISSDLPYFRNPEVTLDTFVNSIRNVEYELNSDHKYFKSIKAQEKHIMAVSSANYIGNQIFSDQILEFVENTQDKIAIVSGTVEGILKNLISSDDLKQESLKIEKENIPTDDIKSFPAAVNELRDQLISDNLGSAGPAKAFIKLVTIARVAKKEEIKKALNGKKNVEILSQLLDVLGSTPTLASYEAVMSKLDFTKEDQIDLCERYLWALSLGANPNPDIAEKLFLKYKKSNDIPVKLNETLLLTLGSMSYKMNLRSPPLGEKVTQKLEKLILEKLRNSKSEESFPYLRALKNLKSPTTIPDLLKKIKEGTSKEGVLAWKALKVFDRKNWNGDVLKAARKAFLQLDRKYDSSSRTIASEILLESKPNDDTLREIIFHIATNDTSYEVRQYALQKIRMLSENDLELQRRVLAIIKPDRKINNYSILNPRGLSTAIKRYFIKNQSGNGSLVSLQEINNAVVKQGIVNIVWEKGTITNELFSLGLFTSGLTSFLSSDNEEIDEEPEQASAGMELTVLGTQFRPFVFFNGQGELMGHVWTGTASEKTTAYQALIMLQDHLEYLRLGSGFIVELDLKGAVSFDLGGKVEISIWGRTAESLVEKRAGIFLTGSMKLYNSFVRVQVEFTATLEPQLKLQSDIDFSSHMRFCMRVSQVDVIVKHNVYKIERIPGSKHKLRIAKYRKSNFPGFTYALNRKNNEMCSAIQQ
ncbi:hypothetical protein HHI36_014651 [Cryptolaemus montrouzieri]|uniref:Vitellogenin domain-containing protein n=1 Tax=Cryptolaemus montrouzieri TaxID=559131 RepID=A0ABD2N3A3_9CUCU